MNQTELKPIDGKHSENSKPNLTSVNSADAWVCQGRIF